jgi:hypothetical protein
MHSMLHFLMRLKGTIRSDVFSQRRVMVAVNSSASQL